MSSEGNNPVRRAKYNATFKPTISHISCCGCPVKAATAEAQALFPSEAPGTETVEGWDDPLWGDRQRARARAFNARARALVEPVIQTVIG